MKRDIVQKGDIVSFKHSGFLASSKRPKFPVLYRVRSDLTWEHVVGNWKDRSPVLPPIVGTMLSYQHNVRKLIIC